VPASVPFSDTVAYRQRSSPELVAKKMARPSLVREVLAIFFGVAEGTRTPNNWNHKPGSAYAQPWPQAFGNSWNTNNMAYKPLEGAGYVYEDWKSVKKPPYEWVEYYGGNSTNRKPALDAFEIDQNAGVLKTNDAGSLNAFLHGPGLDTLTNYTIKGKFKFDSSNAQFGIGFYSQWPDDDKKYSLVRNSDGHVKLYYDVDGNRTELDATDTAVAVSAGAWYNYVVRVETIPGTQNHIFANVWQVGTKDPRDYETPFWMIAAPHNGASRPEDGMAGVVSDSGEGYRYWSPMSVISNSEYQGAHMAYETFREDTIVDIAPYTPANWHASSAYMSFPTTSLDSSGYVLRVTPTDTALVYRDRPGTDHPAIALLAPYSNLQWRNYELTGTIVKPGGPVYDSIEVGFVFYYENQDSYYKIVASGQSDNSVKVKKVDGNAVYSVVTAAGNDIFEGALNELNFGIRIETTELIEGLDTIPDGKILIAAKTWAPGEQEPDYPQPTADTDGNRKISGYAGAQENPLSSSLNGNVASPPITFKKVSLRRL